MFSSVKTKTNPSFAIKLPEGSNHSFLLSIFWWITFLKHLYSLICVIECIELNWLRRHMKKVRSSQAAILVLNWLKQFFPVSTVKTFLRRKLISLFRFLILVITQNNQLGNIRIFFVFLQRERESINAFHCIKR